MITEVSEKNFKKLSFIKRMDASKGGSWWEEFSKDELAQFRKDMDNEITDDWTALLAASTVGDAEDGKFKTPYADFLARGVKSDGIKLEDIYKYQEYFDVFERNKNEFEEKDLGDYKTPADFSYFRYMASTIKRREQEDGTKAKGKTKKEKFKKLLVHQSNGFSMYKIPQKSEMGGNINAYYNASCELGSGTEWCTATGRTKDYFNDYTEDGALYIFISDDETTKYQYHPNSNSFMDQYDVSILSSSEGPIILSYLKGGLEWIDKNEPGGLPLGIKMALGYPKEEIKKIFNFYFDLKADERWHEEMWENFLSEYLQEAGNGNWDNDSVVQKYFKQNQLSPYNHNNWLKLLQLSQPIFERLAGVSVAMVMVDLTEIYGIANLSYAGDDYYIKPYIPLFYEEVIKKGIDEYTIGNTIDFEYEGKL